MKRERRVAREVESKGLVDVSEEVEALLDLTLDLVGAAENMAIVLLETTDAGETSEGTR